MNCSRESRSTGNIIAPLLQFFTCLNINLLVLFAGNILHIVITTTNMQHSGGDLKIQHLLKMGHMASLFCNMIIFYNNIIYIIL